MVRHLYRFHPLTGVDANDIDTTEMSVTDKEELAAMVRHGAKFYWVLDDDGTYFLCEKGNYTFAFAMIGDTFEFHESLVGA